MKQTTPQGSTAQASNKTASSVDVEATASVAPATYQGAVICLYADDNESLDDLEAFTPAAKAAATITSSGNTTHFRARVNTNGLGGNYRVVVGTVGTLGSKGVYFVAGTIAI